MQYLLDANAIIALLMTRRRRSPDAFVAMRPAIFGVSAVVMHELYDGAFKSQRVHDTSEFGRVPRLKVEDLEGLGCAAAAQEQSVTEIVDLHRRWHQGRRVPGSA